MNALDPNRRRKKLEGEMTRYISPLTRPKTRDRKLIFSYINLETFHTLEWFTQGKDNSFKTIMEIMVLWRY